MKLVILDRDGVINEDSEEFIKSADEWIPLQNSLDAIAFLNRSGYQVAIATNQSGLGRKLFDINDLNQIHTKLLEQLRKAGGELVGIWFCPHVEEDQCQCRKPKTGLAEDILNRVGAEVEQTYMVGDSLRDLQCISRLGGRPVLVLTGKGKKTLQKGNLPKDTIICDSLWAFSQEIPIIEGTT
ncbi:MAG: D-glycero-beta-D-manno-heptose 1,7-bisphosphate 7-phosphatase [Neisseriaceae bacterium]